MRVSFFGAGRTAPPHRHFNSVTAHVVLSGTSRVRHYERLREEPGRFVSRASRDRRIGNRPFYGPRFDGFTSRA